MERDEVSSRLCFTAVVFGGSAVVAGAAVEIVRWNLVFVGMVSIFGGLLGLYLLHYAADSTRKSAKEATIELFKLANSASSIPWAVIGVMAAAFLFLHLEEVALNDRDADANKIVAVKKVAAPIDDISGKYLALMSGEPTQLQVQSFLETNAGKTIDLSLKLASLNKQTKSIMGQFYAGDDAIVFVYFAPVYAGYLANRNKGDTIHFRATISTNGYGYDLNNAEPI